MAVSVLYVLQNSVYKTLGVDCWDMDRDARLYSGPNPVICHPPCAQWSRMRGLAHFNADQKALAPLAIQQVRKWGGVLEHPASSILWKEFNLPLPGTFDFVGGWSLLVYQHWWGHLALKPTLLYIVGCSQMQMPAYPLSLDAVEFTVGTGKRPLKKAIPRSLRSATPIRFAQWLVQVAEKCKVEMPADGVEL